MFSLSFKMSILLIIFVCMFLNTYYAICDEIVFSFEPPNLKTVLFNEIDLLPRCWSTYDVNLLLHRRVLADLVPRKIPRDLPLLLKYLQNIEEVFSKIPPNINQTMVLSALGDILGGYLQAIVIPIANEAYYAGNVDYETVAALHAMYNKWKWYLSTDGGTWSQECDMRKIPTKVAILDIGNSDPETACQELYVSPPPNNQTEIFGTQTVISELPRIAIPYFDNNLIPSAIALPFKKRNLYSLHDPKAAYIFVKYYTLSMRCLAPNPNDILAFNNFFHIWLMSKLYPHLHDEKFYPAFGAVMRVIETIKQRGLNSTGGNAVFVQPVSDEHHENELSAQLEMAGDSVKRGKPTGFLYLSNNPYALLIIFILFVIIILLCTGLLCLCCMWRCQAKKKEKVLFGFGSDNNVLKNTLFSLYCGLKDSMAQNAENEPGSGYVDPAASYTDMQDLPHYPQNTPYSNQVDSSDVSISFTSDSDEEYSTTSKE